MISICTSNTLAPETVTVYVKTKCILGNLNCQVKCFSRIIEKITKITLKKLLAVYRKSYFVIPASRPHLTYKAVSVNFRRFSVRGHAAFTIVFVYFCYIL